MNPGELRLDEILARLERDEFTWQPFQPGVEISRLWGDPQHGASSALLRYAPGARVPRHRHEDVEEIRILRGSQRDDDGTYVAGAHITKPAGSVHTVESPEGCVAWLVWRKPNTFVDDIETGTLGGFLEPPATTPLGEAQLRQRDKPSAKS